jgi:hypothetical protein
VARRFKILSDFDGVWTDQGPEAAVLVRGCIAALAEIAGIPVDEAAAEVEALRQQMAAAPHEHGWAPDGRICAYVDEDPLVESSALCHMIDRSVGAPARRYREAVLGGGFESLAAFAQHVYVSSTGAFRRDHPPCIVADARDIVAELEAMDVEVVVVSNSEAEKIVAWFGAAGVDASEHEGHGLRVRGAAAKWFIGDSDAAIDVAGRRIYVDRPRYRAAIEAEQADLVIGDVFSLDLALPHVMRTHGMAAAPRSLVLRHHRHTPSWVLDTAGGGAIDRFVAGLAELPAIVAALRG